MRKTALPLAVMFLLLTFAPELTIASDPPSRVRIIPLFVENGTFRFDKYTGSATYDTVTIGPNGTLEIVGVSFVASRIITSSPQPGSSILIDGTVESWGLLTIQEGLIDVQIGSISIGRADVNVMWSGDPVPPGDPGRNSYLKMETMGGGISMMGANIDIRGQDGGQGDHDTFGGPGGDSQIILKDVQKGDVDIRGTRMRSRGGKGGDVSSRDVRPGEGGRSDISIEGWKTDLRYSHLFSYGGRAGSASAETEGNTGGSAMMRIHSDFDLTLYDTDLTALPGNNSGYPQHPSSSNILLIADHGSVRWDHNKTEDDRMSTLSHLNSPSLQVDAASGARFHQVHLGDTYPTSLDNTEIRLYWWIDIYVTDGMGTPVKGAMVYYDINEGSEIYPDIADPLITDDRGIVTFELIANTGLDWRRYRFHTQFSGLYVRGSTDVIRFDINSNRIQEIPLQLAEIVVNTDMEHPETDLWEINGTAYSLTGDPISSMSFHIDDGIVFDVVNLSTDPDNPYSFWSSEINTSKISPGIHLIELLIVIDDLITRRNWTVEFPISVYNHPPVIDDVLIVTGTSVYETSPGVEYPVHVTPTSPGFKVEIRISELDHNSEILGEGDGMKLSGLQVRIIMYDHPLEVFHSEPSFTGSEEEEIGRYRSFLEIDTTIRQDRYDPWTSGRYLMKITAFDDSGTGSKEYQVFLYLHVDQAPLLNLRWGKEEPQNPVPHPTRSEEVFFFDVAEGGELKEYFDLTGCKDLDDPSYFPHPAMDRSWKNLTAAVYIQPTGTDPVLVFGPVKGAEGFEHSFDMKNYSNGDSVLFEITIKVRDADGVESELTVLADVTVGPPVIEGSEPIPVWIILVLAVLWTVIIVVSFSVVLPIYSRRKADRVRRLLKDPKLQGAAREALKGEKPSDHFISRRGLEEGLKEKVKKRTLDPADYQQIMEDMDVHKKK